jgi:hypothetical protein
METETCTECPNTNGERLNTSCPEKMAPLLLVNIVFAVPSSTFVDVSYESPTAYSWLPMSEHPADTGTIMPIFELYDVVIE